MWPALNLARPNDPEATQRFQTIGEAWSRVRLFHDLLSCDDDEPGSPAGAAAKRANCSAAAAPSDVPQLAFFTVSMLEQPDDVLLCIINRLGKGQRAGMVLWPQAACGCTCRRLRDLVWEHASYSFEAKVKSRPSELARGARPQLMLVSHNLSTADGLVIARLLASEVTMHAILELNLGMNVRLGDPALHAMVAAFSHRPVCRQLLHFYMHQTSLGDASVVALAKAIRGGALPELAGLRLSSNKIGWAGANALAETLEAGGFRNLLELKVWGNQIGDKGMLTLAKSAGVHGRLCTLWLHKDRAATKAGREAVTALSEGFLRLNVKV